MDQLFNSEDFEFFKKIIFKAGSIARDYQKKNFKVERKNDNSIVTQADYLVQDYLISKISAKYKNFNYIHEENFDSSSSKIDDSTVSVIIDPIDGTAMYSMYLPIWCVSVGIFVGYKPVYGFVYSPGSSMFYYCDDNNSYLNENKIVIDKSLTVEKETNILYSSEIHGKIDIQFSGKIRNLGSTALHACLMADNARNRMLAYIGRSYLWDWAGAIPIIIKAEGNFKYLNGDNINFEEIFNNKFMLKDYLIVYNVDDFNKIKKIFVPVK